MTVNLTRDRPAPPPLEYDYPPCSLCGKTVALDGDTFYCPSCGAQWNASSAHYSEGEWARGDDRPQCTSTLRPWPEHPKLSDTVYRCALDRGHDGKHRASDWGWDGWDSWPEAAPREAVAR